MDSTIRIEGLPGVTLEAGHTPYIEALKRYLSERGYAAQTVRSYGYCAGISCGGYRANGSRSVT